MRNMMITIMTFSFISLVLYYVGLFILMLLFCMSNNIEMSTMISYQKFHISFLLSCMIFSAFFKSERNMRGLYVLSWANSVCIYNLFVYCTDFVQFFKARLSCPKLASTTAKMY